NNYYQQHDTEIRREYPKREYGEEHSYHRPTQSYSSQPPMVPQHEQHITTVQHVGFTDALIAQKPSPWTKTMFKLYFFLLVAFVNSCINGYDGSLMGGINAMKQYQA